MSSVEADLDDGVHARSKLVVNAHVALGVFADLDDILGNRLATDKRIILVERKCKRYLLLAFHMLPSLTATPGIPRAVDTR